jgi:glycosyltransferase involved in cell wall biosynthesis
MPFDVSVLIAVYYKEIPDHLHCALESIFGQTCRPKEVILIKDGLLSGELEKVIEFWKNKENVKLKTFQLEKNMGLALALNFGLQHCACEFIARMDSDDIASPYRFEKQLNFLMENNDIDVVGSYILEYDAEMKIKQGIRKVPLEHNDIARFAKWRNPMNHMTVVFRKKAVLNSGGYKIKFFEDYCLWAQMIKNGYKFANTPDTLISARTGNDFIVRRSGFKYFEFEKDMLKYLKKIAFINQTEYYLSYLIRKLSRVLPANLLAFFYKFLRHKT